jgi:hypothetical protein
MVSNKTVESNIGTGGATYRQIYHEYALWQATRLLNPTQVQGQHTDKLTNKTPRHAKLNLVPL